MLKKVLLGAVTTLAVGGATLGLATTADAAPWGGFRGGYHGGYYGGYHRGFGGAGLLGAGILGVAIGASLAHPYYGAPPAYYAGPGYWGYYGGCRAYWRWDPYWGRYVRVDRCY